MICQIQYYFFCCPFDILQYKFLSYREVLHVLSESSELSQLSELIELPEVFSSMEKCLLHQALRLGDPLIKLLELMFVSSSSETSRSSGTIQTSQSSISSHPAFPDELIFLPQNHPKYFWKHLGTKGRLPTFKVERLDREFPIRKVPISVNMSGWSNSGIIQRPQRVLLQTFCNVRRWILLVNGFP